MSPKGGVTYDLRLRAVEPTAAGRPQASAFLALAGPRRILRYAQPPRPQLGAAERPTVLQRTKQTERAPLRSFQSSARLAPPARRRHPAPRCAPGLPVGCQPGGAFRSAPTASGSAAASASAVAPAPRPLALSARARRGRLRCRRFGPPPQDWVGGRLRVRGRCRTRRCRPTLGASVFDSGPPSAYPAVPPNAVPSA